MHEIESWVRGGSLESESDLVQVNNAYTSDQTQTNLIDFEGAATIGELLVIILFVKCWNQTVCIRYFIVCICTATAIAAVVCFSTITVRILLCTIATIYVSVKFSLRSHILLLLI